MTPVESEVAHAAAGLHRRGFLKLMALATAAGVVPSGCGSGSPAWTQPPPDVALKALSPRAYATLTAVSARVAGPAVGDGIAAGRLRPGAIADAWLARTPSFAGPLGQALALLEFGVRPLLAKWRPFTSLDGAAQDAVLDDLRTSSIATKRAMYAGVRSVALLAVYLSPEQHAAIGYPPPFGTAAVSIADAMAPLP